MQKKPRAETNRPEDYPFLSIGFSAVPTVREGKFTDVQAGLLTLGSSYFPRLPIPNPSEQWRMAAFVPDYSGGPVPYLRRSLLSFKKHPNRKTVAELREKSN